MAYQSEGGELLLEMIIGGVKAVGVEPTTQELKITNPLLAAVPPCEVEHCAV
jgi:hypothetical protein